MKGFLSFLLLLSTQVGSNVLVVPAAGKLGVVPPTGIDVKTTVMPEVSKTLDLQKPLPEVVRDTLDIDNALPEALPEVVPEMEDAHVMNMPAVEMEDSASMESNPSVTLELPEVSEPLDIDNPLPKVLPEEGDILNRDENALVFKENKEIAADGSVRKLYSFYTTYSCSCYTCSCGKGCSTSCCSTCYSYWDYCAAGRYYPNGYISSGSTCTACPAGRYQPYTGYSYCFTCPAVK
jgi:hypothetical protein